MASTSELLRYIQLEAHGWTIEGPRGIRPILNEAHKILMSVEREQNLIYDETTGDFPYFATTSAVYRYDCPSTVWRVHSVLVDRSNYLDYGALLNNRQWRYEELNISGVDYLRIRNIRTQDARRSTVANITFIGMDPGTTTATYRRAAYKKPVEITSDAIQHEIPEPFDMEYLMPAVMKIIDEINDHGKMNDSRLYIERELKPKMWQEIDGGEQGCAGYCIKRAY